MKPLPLLLCAFAVGATGCGNPVHSHYTVKAAAPCLRKLGYRVQTANLDVIAESAPEGALRARKPGNTLTITFATDEAGTKTLESAYRRFVSKKLRPHLSDVMESQKNAVLLWTVTPAQDEHARVLECLRSG